MENRDAIGSSENEAVNPQQGKGGAAYAADSKEDAPRGNQAAPSGGASSGTSAAEEGGGGGEDREGRRGLGGDLGGGGLGGGVGGRHGSGRLRQPFTEMNQLESDMALARAIQEQERAFVLLRSSSFRMGGFPGVEFDDGDQDGGHRSDEGADASNEEIEIGDVDGEDEENEDDDDVDAIQQGGYYTNDEVDLHADGSGSALEEVDGSQFESDEAFARALQEAEDRATTARMMALTNVRHGSTESDYGSDPEGSQDEWDGEHEHAAFEDLMLGEGAGVDPDQMSYEELMALSEAVGSESRGLKSTDIAALPTSVFTTGERRASSSGVEQCVVCRVEFEEGDNLITLPCDHYYHKPCISQWLSINKACPMCGGETKPPAAGSSQGGHGGQ